MSLGDHDSLASVTLPPPPFSSSDFGDHIPEDINQSFFSKTDQRENYLNNLWQENYQSEEKLNLNEAFNNLYKEYVSVCEKYLENENMRKFNSGDNQISEINIENKIKKIDNISQTLEKINHTESPEGLKKSLNFSVFKNFKNLFVPSIDFGSCMKKSSKGVNNFNLIIIDQLIKENINVFEVREKSRQIISHQILNKNNNKMVKVPIALELLLKKMQQKVDYILLQCPFLCDPLEVMCELRNHEYEEEKCVKYFQETKYLRYLYHGVGECEGRVLKSGDGGQNKGGEGLICLEWGENGGRREKIDTNILIENEKHKREKVNYKTISFSSINNYAIIDYSIIDNTNISLKLFNISTQTDEKPKNITSLSNDFSKLKKSQNDIHVDVKYLAYQLNKVFDSLKNHMITVINQCSERLINNEQKLRLMTFSRQVEELKIKLKEEEKKRRQVYNRMQEQMGNVRVYCRCRNLSDDENVLEYSGEDSLILTTVSNEKFEFDKVFPPGVSQSELYEEFRPLVMSFIDGYNVCFITYGGEASGKTYTLIGDNRDQSHQGIMQRSLLTILIEEKLRHRDWEYKISACVVEIYNDNCTDILSGESGIQIYVDNGMETAYQKLKSVPITNEADADVLIQVCTVKRKVARTALNPASSRSHLIILIRLQGCSKIHGENICSFLCLSDLAGFEDIIKAETQTNKVLSKEAGYINRSLTAFNRVFVSLKKQDPNTVSYRDTKLTHLLKPFLTNSGKCALIVTIRNDKRSIGSTHNTLRFGKETRGVSLGKARRQVNLNNHPSAMS